ncbi:Integrase catalytic domain-containing protein [Mycena sanguinolenta]|uniref:Integrase catalytic domain-containing protein n=1 Tax=Mycena sanguinolenta TaxID=230812 RepID=A0A8H6XJF5_9AGAR|nr:Integrase catalytic domain-containing protein [Mycena sanguinolenta]
MQEDPWTYPAGVKPDRDEEDWNKRAHLLISASESVKKSLRKAYREDPYFKNRYVEEIPNPERVLTPSRFQKGQDGLLYFIDADWRTRLCIPRTKVNWILRWIHDAPHESAHAGPFRFLARLRELFFWKTLAKDAEEFAQTCDVCQKIKIDHRQKMGGLRPAHVPARPFATVSLDLITGLPPSGEERYTAILAIVDKLTRFAIIIPTHNELSQEGFAKFFVDRVVNVFGMPERIICDRDRRWATAFWRSVTDGQTEILNAMIEQMLRAYVATDRSSWSRWLGEIAFAYNSSVHSSTGYSPNFLLFGYHPRGAAGLIAPAGDNVVRPFLPSQKGEDFIAAVEMHRAAARDAVVLAQERQAKAYNKGRRSVDKIEEGDFVLVNPHLLELVDVQGTGKKLVQRTIGPFEVLEKINPVVYRLRLPDTYPMHPVVNLEHLRKYHTSKPEFGERTKLPETHDYIASQEYVVEAIIGHMIKPRKNGNQRFFRVRWEGYGPADDTWVSERDLRNAPALKREYLQLHRLT